MFSSRNNNTEEQPFVEPHPNTIPSLIARISNAVNKIRKGADTNNLQLNFYLSEAETLLAYSHSVRDYNDGKYNTEITQALSGIAAILENPGSKYIHDANIVEIDHALESMDWYVSTSRFLRAIGIFVSSLLIVAAAISFSVYLAPMLTTLTLSLALAGTSILSLGLFEFLSQKMDKYYSLNIENAAHSFMKRANFFTKNVIAIDAKNENEEAAARAAKQKNDARVRATTETRANNDDYPAQLAVPQR